MNKTILITGGAGYIGSVLTRILLQEGHDVIAFDNLSYGGQSLLSYMSDPHFSLYKGDIRNDRDLEGVFKRKIHSVVHLAALVGDPVCSKNPEMAREVNLLGSKKLLEFACKNKVERFVFASTCSNYGKMKDPNGMVDENSTLSPVSLYAETKVEIEKFMLDPQSNLSCGPVCLRFATAYGLSPRMRFDLTVNEFTKMLAENKELIVFGEQFWRPYCHTLDLSRAVATVLRAPAQLVHGQVFNVGNSTENYQKKTIVEKIRTILPDAKVKFVHKEEDPRDYKVSFEKIKKVLDFQTTKTIMDGIEEIHQTLKLDFFPARQDFFYGNT